MEIHIWSDVACPFCYIGREHLRIALKFSGVGDAHLTWHSFQLDPSIAKEDEGRSILEHLSVKKGMSMSQVEQMMGSVESMGREVGLTLNLSSTQVYNTLSCHLVLQYAKSKGMGDAMKHALLERHFVRNQNLSEVQFLNEALLEIGILDIKAETIIADEHWMRKFEEDLYTAQQFNIRGVPYFVFDNKYALSGAQPVDVFVRVLKQTLEDSK